MVPADDKQTISGILRIQTYTIHRIKSAVHSRFMMYTGANDPREEKKNIIKQSWERVMQSDIYICLIKKTKKKQKKNIVPSN